MTLVEIEHFIREAETKGAELEDANDRDLMEVARLLDAVEKRTEAIRAYTNRARRYREQLQEMRDGMDGDV